MEDSWSFYLACFSVIYCSHYRTQDYFSQQVWKELELWKHCPGSCVRANLMPKLIKCLPFHISHLIKGMRVLWRREGKFHKGGEPKVPNLIKNRIWKRSSAPPPIKKLQFFLVLQNPGYQKLGNVLLNALTSRTFRCWNGKGPSWCLSELSLLHYLIQIPSALRRLSLEGDGSPWSLHVFPSAVPYS